MCIFTELERGMVVSRFFVETLTHFFLIVAPYKSVGGDISSLGTLPYDYVIKIFLSICLIPEVTMERRC